jgi:hypothetical protein
MKKLLSNSYGFVGEFDEVLVTQIKTLAGIELELRDSSYWGAYWSYRYNSKDGDGTFKLYFNIDPMHEPDDDPPEEFYFDFENKDCDVLLSIDGETKWVERIHSSIINIESIKLIKSEIYGNE